MLTISARWRMKRLNIEGFEPLFLLGFYALCSPSAWNGILHQLYVVVPPARVTGLHASNRAFTVTLSVSRRIVHRKVTILSRSQHCAFSATYVLAPIALGPLYLLSGDALETGSVANSVDELHLILRLTPVVAIFTSRKVLLTSWAESRAHSGKRARVRLDPSILKASTSGSGMTSQYRSCGGVLAWFPKRLCDRTMCSFLLGAGANGFR